MGEVPERNEATADGTVRVEAPARLHFGFLDLHGGLGRRVRAVTEELGGEKIDIVDYDETLPKFVANALSPAKVTSSFVLDQATKAVRALVPDYQLSLAIGKEGQNARLAAKLTGAKIDIQPDSILDES